MADWFTDTRLFILRAGRRVVTASLLIGVTLAADNGRAAEDPRLVDFLEQFAAMREREKAGEELIGRDWFKFGGPWALYVGQTFTSGLSDTDRERHLAAQEARDCKTVATLERRGFLALYPFLEDVFANDKVADSFESHVLRRSKAAPGYRRCEALARLDRSLDDLRQEGITPNPVDVRPFMTSRTPILYDSIRIMKDLRRKGIRTWHLKLPPANKRDMEICGALQALSSLAVTHAYVPALEDVLELLIERRLLIYSADAEYYLLELARRLGILEQRFEDRRLSLRLELGQQRRKEIDATVTDRWSHRVTWPYVYCSHIDLMTRLEASGAPDD